MISEFELQMAHIVDSIRTAGYDPYAQLYGYLKTGDATYITRTGGARSLINGLDRYQVKEYLETHFRR